MVFRDLSEGSPHTKKEVKICSPRQVSRLSHGNQTMARRARIILRQHRLRRQRQTTGSGSGDGTIRRTRVITTQMTSL